MKQTNRVVVLASGGIESNTLIAKLLHEGSFVTGLYFDLGLASHEQQLYCAKTAVAGERSKLEQVNVRGLRNLILEFVPPEHLAGEADKICPDIEWMPIYAAIATYYAEAAQIGQIYLGFTGDQMDKNRSSFFKTLGKTFASYQKGITPVVFEAPFSSLEKADVVAEGLKLGVDYSKTWSCLHGGTAHCGECERCIARRAAFTRAKAKDPTTYLKK